MSYVLIFPAYAFDQRDSYAFLKEIEESVKLTTSPRLSQPSKSPLKSPVLFYKN